MINMEIFAKFALLKNSLSKRFGRAAKVLLTVDFCNFLIAFCNIHSKNFEIFSGNGNIFEIFIGVQFNSIFLTL